MFEFWLISVLVVLVIAFATSTFQFYLLNQRLICNFAEVKSNWRELSNEALIERKRVNKAELEQKKLTEELDRKRIQLQEVTLSNDLLVVRIKHLESKADNGCSGKLSKTTDRGAAAKELGVSISTLCRFELCKTFPSFENGYDIEAINRWRGEDSPGIFKSDSSTRHLALAIKSEKLKEIQRKNQLLQMDIDARSGLNPQ